MALEASEVAVRVRLLGGSAFQAEADKVAGSTEAIGAAGRRASRHAAIAGTGLASTGSKLQSVGNKMIGFGRTLTMVGIPLAAVGGYAMKTANTFQQQMTLLSTQAGEQRRNLGWMSRAVLGLGKQFGALPTEIAKGLYNFESVGIHGKAALNDIKAAAMGSAVGLDSLANTTDAVSSIMTSKIKGAGGPVEAMSIMDRTIGLGKMHLSDLTDSFKSAIVPMSQQFGITFQQLMAAEAALTRIGVPAGQATARMRLMYTSMVAPSGAGAKALGDIGVAPHELGNILRSPGGLPAALEDLQMKMSLLSPGDRDSVLASVFGRSRGMGQIVSMLSQLPTIQSIYGQVMKTTPETLYQHFGQTQQTSAFKYAQIHAQLDKEMIQLGQTLNDKLLPVFVRLVPFLTRTVDGFSHLPKPLQDFALGVIGFTIVGGPLFLFGGALVKGAGMFMGGMEAIVGIQGMTAFRTGLAMTAVELTALAAPIAAVLGVYAIWKNKGIHHAVEHAGQKAGSFVGDFLAKDLVALGFKHADDYYAVQRYLGGREFKSYKPLIQSDIEGLMNPNSFTANHLGQVYGDFAQYGKNVNLKDVPGISAAVKQAIVEGMKEANVSVVLPTGKVLAQTVNEVNRKAQNRR